MDTIVIPENMNGLSQAVIFAILFIGIIIYLLIITAMDRKEYDNMTLAKKLIEEGHAKALKGKKDDGIYSETKRIRDTGDDMEGMSEEAYKWKEEISESVKRDKALLDKKRFI